MKNKMKVLRFFIENKNKKFSIMQVSKILNLNYRIAYEEVSKLTGEGVITSTKMGNSKICEFSYKHNSDVFFVEITRKNEFLKNKDLKIVCKRIEEIKNPFYILILFGSYADGTNSKGSDIDLCLISDDERINKSVNEVLNLTPVGVHLNEFTSSEFLSMLNEKKGNLGHEIVSNNIILHGIENFYELINYVK